MALEPTTRIATSTTTSRGNKNRSPSSTKKDMKTPKNTLANSVDSKDIKKRNDR